MSLTRKYEVSFKNHNTVCVATYYNGQFKKLEYKRGGMKAALWKKITVAVPFYEHHISEVVKVYENLFIEKIASEGKGTLYSKFMEVYFSWYHIYSNGLKPKITSTEGQALKQTIAYLNDISATEEEALSVWKQIFTYWDRLDEFYQGQIQLRQINSNLNTVLMQIKNGNTKTKQQKTANNNADDLRSKV